jgi:Fic family protein
MRTNGVARNIILNTFNNATDKTPTLRELVKIAGVSKTNVFYHLNKLDSEGLLNKPIRRKNNSTPLGRIKLNPITK